MALNPENVKFLFQQIAKSELRTYNSVVSQLFGYLDLEVKDNPVFDKYESEWSKWSEWIEGIEESSYDWSLPKRIDDTKSLIYNIYRGIAKNDQDWLINFSTELFQERNFSDSIYKFNNSFIDYLGKALEDIIEANPEIEANTAKKTNNDTVFIIHGHDNTLKMEVQLLLNRAAVNNIVLHEQADRGRTIIDKLLDETNKAGYAIALLTPDDILENEAKRARQNVILEIGYFIGLLGKERIRLLVKDGVEVPSDLQGILYEKYEASGSWKIKLLKEMQAVGIYVDMKGVIDQF